MKDSFILDFLKKKVQASSLSFFQYAKREKLQHLGGAEILEEEFRTYIPDNIQGFTSTEKAMSLEPIKMAYELAPGVKLTYELDYSSAVDWVRNGRLIQVGLCYKGVTIKLYECVFGYAPHTQYENSDNIETFKSAQKMGNIHYGINAFVGVKAIMEKINWGECLDPEDKDFPDLQANGLVKHSNSALPSEILELFIQENSKRLHVSDVFALVMNFGASTIKIDVSNKPIEEVHFHTDYALSRNFKLPANIAKVAITFPVTNEHRDFLKFNRDLLLAAKGLKIDSKLYSNMKQAQLQELAQEYCLISYKGSKLNGAVLSNKMAYKLLVERIEEASGKLSIPIPGTNTELSVQRKKFLSDLSCEIIDLETLNFLRDTLGKTVGATGWYDPTLEGSLFRIKDKTDAKSNSTVRNTADSSVS